MSTIANKILQKMKKLMCFILITSVLAIISAYFVEYVLKVKPCALCYYQRVPYYATIFVSGLGLFIKNAKHIKYLILTCIIIFLVGGGLSIYHVGVERGIIEQPISCATSNSTKELSIDEVKKLIYSTNETSCKEVSFKIFGLSMAEMNFILSALMVAFLALVLKRLPTHYP